MGLGANRPLTAARGEVRCSKRRVFPQADFLPLLFPPRSWIWLVQCGCGAGIEESVPRTPLHGGRWGVGEIFVSTTHWDVAGGICGLKQCQSRHLGQLCPGKVRMWHFWSTHCPKPRHSRAKTYTVGACAALLPLQGG